MFDFTLPVFVTVYSTAGMAHLKFAPSYLLRSILTLRSHVRPSLQVAPFLQSSFFLCFADSASQYNLSNNLMHKILFYNKFIICLYVFRALCAHHQVVKIVLYIIWCYVAVLCTGRSPTGVTIPDDV